MKQFILTHKLLCIVLACVIVAGAACAIILPVALKHEHAFASEWTSDENNHWHKATCEHKDEKSGLAAHDFNDGEITTPATEEAAGVKTFTCKTCWFKKTEEVKKLEHTHKFATEWTSNETNHWHAATCDHKDEKSGFENHSFDDGEVTTPATEEAEGVMTYTCTVCDYKKNDSIGKLEHTHKFAAEWTSDENNHWHAATCDHTDEKSDVGEHVEEWVVKTPAGYGVDRVEKKICSVCNFDFNEEKTIEKSRFEYTGDFYMIVDDVFSITDKGVFLTGTVSMGSISVGDKISVSGFEGELTVMGLNKSGSSTSLQSVGYGDGEISIILGTAVSRDGFRRGNVVTKVGTVNECSTFTAEIYVFTKDEGGRHTPFMSGFKCFLYIDGIDVGECTITLLGGAEMAMPGSDYTVTITLTTAIPLYVGMKFTCHENSSITLLEGTIINIVAE